MSLRLAVKIFCVFLFVTSLYADPEPFDLDEAATAPDPYATHPFAPPHHLALLLPLTGSLAGPGSAIRDGFMHAYQQGTEHQRITVKTYDTAATPVERLYQEAIDAGAEYIVGPLTKADVAKISALPHPVPTLLLNDTPMDRQSNLFTFALSSTQEARFIAGEAHRAHYRRALIIAPDDGWGNEVANALAIQWQSQGGQIVDSLYFQMGKDLDPMVKTFLHVDDSNQRSHVIKELLGYSIMTELSRRQDFDVIFLLAYPSKARQIVPLLNYYYAQEMPIYAPSTVYSGYPNPAMDRDLNHVVFCDMPYVFTHHGDKKNWPEQLSSYNRLYAMGLDSYVLATQLNELIQEPSHSLHLHSGILQLDANLHIIRALQCAQFNQGLAVLL